MKDTEFGSIDPVAKNIMDQDKTRDSRSSQGQQQNSPPVSFRGKPIPVVEKKQPYTVANSEEVINKVKKMSDEELNQLTIVAIHKERWQISEVKLSTGDVIDVETAIALAENDYLRGFSTGATMKGGRTLRTKPSPDDSGKNGIYSLPRF